jgi:pimeloyl-ACP methyl ester carboxylesterase
MSVLAAATWAAVAGAQARPAAVRAPAVSADQWVVSDGVWLHYRVVGAGPPLLVLHGYTDRRDPLLPLALALGTSRRVVLLDQRGFGMSGKPMEASQYGTAFVDDVVALLDGLRLGRVDVLGHGVGALVAAKLAATHPERVRRAVLVGAPLYPDSARLSRVVAPALAALGRGAEVPTLTYASATSAERTAARVRAPDTAALRLVDPRALRAAAQSLTALVVRERDVARLRDARLRVPVLAIAGARDPFADAARDLPRWWPGATASLLDGVAPDDEVSDARLVAQVRAFLAAP